MADDGENDTNSTMQIAGERTCADWKKLKGRLKNDPKQWKTAYMNFFFKRLESRYFGPIRNLQAVGGNCGVGFSIVSIQCTLIEFLQTTRDGTNFRDKGGRYKEQDCKEKPKCTKRDCCIEHGVGVYGNGHSKSIFNLFLSQQSPFDKYFCSEHNKNLICPDDFYFKVRCSLLHEARTTGNWRITANPKRSETISVEDGVTYLQRDLFQKDLEAYVCRYKEGLLSDSALQDAFIIKFDSLCR